MTEQEYHWRARFIVGEPLDFIDGQGEEGRTSSTDCHNADVLSFIDGQGEEGRTSSTDCHNADVLSLRSPRTSEPTELRSRGTGQVQELLLNLLFTEVSRARDLLLVDRLGEALQSLQHAERVQRTLMVSSEPVSTSDPAEFVHYRDELAAVFGFQSSIYRQLEFTLGNKSARMAAAYHAVPWVYAQVAATLRAPSLYDAVLILLRHRGVDIPEKCVARDFAQPYEPNPAVEVAWAEIYRSNDGDRELYMLAEALSELNYQFSQWRTAHLLTVERVVGRKLGVGSTAEGKWLGEIAEYQFFPELWSVRSEIYKEHRENGMHGE